MSADDIANFMIPPPGIYGLLSTLKFSETGPNSSKFCELCADFKISSIAEEEDELPLLTAHISVHKTYQVYEDSFPYFSALQRRARKGCALCSFICESLRVELAETGPRWLGADKRPVQIVLSARIHERVDHRSALAMYRDHGPHVMRIRVITQSYGEDRVIVSYEATLRASVAPTVTIQTPLAGINVAQIGRWLSECDNGHASCRTALTKYAPTRLIAVRGNPLRLVHGNTTCSRYTALSYCWGQTRDKRVLTTSTNLSDRSNGFRIDDLSKTLQDAVQTTRTLGIDYIWIDAICITQDDPDEWATEASRMGDIYKHAYLTIVPAISTSTSDGFLQDRTPCFKASLDFHLEEFQTIRAQREAVPRGTIHFRYPPEEDISKDLAGSKWNQRGWTLQEKLLSTRLLYFTKQVVYYECAESQRAEHSGYQLPKSRRLPAAIIDDGDLKPVNRNQHRREILSSWYKVVADYTHRSLTHVSDKLPALQGLSEVFRKKLDDEYLYGLWTSDLAMGLLWRGGSRRYHRQYRAPSWSWASRESGVCWDESSFEIGWTPLIRVLGITTHKLCAHCEESMGVRLEVETPVAPLKDVLLAYYPDDEDADQEDFKDLHDFGEYNEFGRYEIDVESDMPIWLDGTEMMLVAENDEKPNLQAIIIQSFGSENHFRRIGWFILNETVREMGEDGFDNDFDDNRKVFKTERRLLV